MSSVIKTVSDINKAALRDQIQVCKLRLHVVRQIERSFSFLFSLLGLCFRVVGLCF